MFKPLHTGHSLHDMHCVFTTFNGETTNGSLNPVSTAECKQAFSCMNQIKTELRNCFKTSTHVCQMLVSIYGQLLENFIFEHAANIIGEEYNRRIFDIQAYLIINWFLSINNLNWHIFYNGLFWMDVYIHIYFCVLDTLNGCIHTHLFLCTGYCLYNTCMY